MPNASSKAKAKSGANAFFTQRGRRDTVQRQRNHPEQIQAHQQENDGDNIIGCAAQIARHASQGNRERTDEGEGDQNSHRKRGGQGRGVAMARQ